jgi:hypothetical protein
MALPKDSHNSHENLKKLEIVNQKTGNASLEKKLHKKSPIEERKDENIKEFDQEDEISPTEGDEKLIDFLNEKYAK